MKSAVYWYFYAFDYGKYIDLSKLLANARSPGYFSAISNDDETKAICKKLQDGMLSYPQARQHFVQKVCCLEEPAVFDSSLLRVLGRFTKQRDAFEISTILSELMGGKKNLENWMLPAKGIVGFLTPDEVHYLYELYAPRIKTGELTLYSTKSRQGGFLSACLEFIRRLFDRSMREEDVVELLGEAIHEAHRNNHGLAVISS